jgi:hypothetical protein
VPLILLLLALLACAACASSDEAEEDDTGDAGESAERGALAASAAEARRSRGPWFDHVDTLARRYPAFGVTLHHMAYIYEAPKKDARPIGYLRRGARFRAGEEVARTGCTRGWFEIAGGGYVCAGEAVSVDSEPPAYAEPPVLPVLSDPLPYRYVKNVNADLPQFVRLPSPEEERAAAGTVSGGLTLNAAGVPVVDTAAAQLAALVRLRMQPGFYVSVDREIEADKNRRFLRTVRGGLIRAEQLQESKQPAGLGVAIGSQFTLPLAFVYRTGAPSLRLDPITRELVKAGAELPVYSAHALTGESIVKAGRRYFMTRAGLFLRDTAIRIVERVPRPRPVPRNERWIRVDLDRQTLTAYEGETPVFATLVASGLPDHATPIGMYRLHAKHVSTTMDDLATDGPYSIEDVPWTMYFLGSYALHAAFWHDRFGNQRSHGCVNLAPRDARWLFFWTLPELPSAWHGVLAGVGQGTTIVLDSGVTYALEQGT